MSRETVKTEAAPQAIGPYSQAVKVDGLVLTAGQLPMDPETMQLVGDDIETQTAQVMRNMAAVLDAAGAGFADLVKTTVFLKDLGHFSRFNDIYAHSFEGCEPPARSTVQVAALPLGALVEIEAIARIPGR
jgi:2-iminobutanoate/2-iminopropanoate deaminase